MARASTEPRIIVALDFADTRTALACAARLPPGRCRVKVGKELYTGAGPAIVEALHERGFDVFLDLKFHDIPNTVAGACRAAASLGCWMLNVHASGGRAMLEAARGAIESARPRPRLIAVTVLTSLDAAQLRELGIADPPAVHAERLARLARAAGLDGVVASAAEAASLRACCGPGFLLVTPGIRPAGADADDQKRVATPASAIGDGADYLVIGRPITGAPDPARALEDIESSIRAATGA
jgi:orotidine-5'-phosphate decarboxylase